MPKFDTSPEALEGLSIKEMDELIANICGDPSIDVPRAKLQIVIGNLTDLLSVFEKMPMLFAIVDSHSKQDIIGALTTITAIRKTGDLIYDDHSREGFITFGRAVVAEINAFHDEAEAKFKQQRASEDDE